MPAVSAMPKPRALWLVRPPWAALWAKTAAALSIATRLQQIWWQPRPLWPALSAIIQQVAPLIPAPLQLTALQGPTTIHPKILKLRPTASIRWKPGLRTTPLISAEKTKTPLARSKRPSWWIPTARRPSALRWKTTYSPPCSIRLPLGCFLTKPPMWCWKPAMMSAEWTALSTRCTRQQTQIPTRVRTRQRL